jgi:hypothetical protein
MRHRNETSGYIKDWKLIDYVSVLSAPQIHFSMELAGTLYNRVEENHSQLNI